MKGKDELESLLGEGLRSLRLSKNISQQLLAGWAGVGVRTIQNLENGEGSSLSTLIRVMSALGCEQQLKALVPVGVVEPVSGSRKGKSRKRARSDRVRGEARYAQT